MTTYKAKYETESGTETIKKITGFNAENGFTHIMHHPHASEYMEKFEMKQCGTEKIHIPTDRIIKIEEI